MYKERTVDLTGSRTNHKHFDKIIKKNRHLQRSSKTVVEKKNKYQDHPNKAGVNHDRFNKVRNTAGSVLTRSGSVRALAA